MTHYFALYLRKGQPHHASLPLRGSGGKTEFKKTLFVVNILFICSRNQWRSRTAETIFKKHPDHHVKSAGTAKDARIKINAQMILWADMIFVMEKRHKEILEENFGNIIRNKKIITLDIEDRYEYMDEELIEVLKAGVSLYL